MAQLFYIESNEHDPWYNLALEEHLLKNIQPGSVMLYLWQNDHTVVIGRNQNPWKECACKAFEADGGKLARRLSGGGAVYHDLGNLNFTFIMSSDLYDFHKQLEAILAAVQKAGIQAQFTGRNDIVYNERKFSGNAFYHGKNASYHHGTLLVDTNFEKLVTYLNPSADKIRAKGIESVRSRVINLASVCPDLSIDAMKQYFRAAFEEVYGGKTQQVSVSSDDTAFSALHQQYASWEWRYGNTPAFDLSFTQRFGWGGADVQLSFSNSQIKTAIIYSDAMDADIIEAIAQHLPGTAFSRKALIQSRDILTTTQGDNPIIEDIFNEIMAHC